MLIQFYADTGVFSKVEPYASELAGDFNTFDGYTALSHAMQNQGQLEEAIALLERAVVAYPQYPTGYGQLINLYYQLNDTARVMETFERWRTIAPEDTVIKTMIEELRQSLKVPDP